MDDYEHIAAYYDCEHDRFVEDIAFYLDRITGGPVLEIGVGTGRIMAPLLGSGLEVWGVDPSAAMLQRAERRVRSFPAAHLLRGGVDVLPPDARFPTVILPLNTLWHIPDNDAQVHLLRTIRTRMTSGSRLFIDVSNPLSLADRGARGAMRERFSGQCEGGHLRIVSAAWDNEAEQQLQLSLTYDLTRPDGSLLRTHATLELRYLYQYELELVLGQAGFSVVDLYGSYEGEPYETESPNLIAVAQPY